MEPFDSDMTGQDFESLEGRLRDERPELSALRLDEIKLAVKRSARRGNTQAARKGTLMKSRLALTMVLAVGVMMTGTGATIAITGASDSGSAGVAQYGSDGVRGVSDENLGGGGPSGGGDVQGAQEVRQVGAQGGEDSLPFTGFLAIPLLIGGVALTGVGAALRRRTRD